MFQLVVPPPRTELLSRKHAAEYLGIAEGTLAVWACTGRYDLPVIKIGRLSKYRISDLDTFIQNNVTKLGAK